MKRLYAGIFAVAVLLACAAIASPQNNPRGTAKTTLNGKDVSVEYGRPSLGQRKVEDMLGKVGSGQVWRLGADKSTTFKTDTDLSFGDATVAKGEYSLFALKESENSWKLVFNSQHGQWGTDHDASKDVVSVPLKVEKEGNADQLTIKLEKEGEGNEISIQWGDMELSANFKAK